MLSLLRVFSILMLASSALVCAAHDRQGEIGRVGRHYHGVVTAVDAASITVQQDGQQPKRFVASDTLAAGKTPSTARVSPQTGLKYFVLPPDMYRLKDVKVGDWVNILYAEAAGGDICDHICIRKHPGGRVPQLPNDVKDSRIPYHEMKNAYWDLEDKGIPYPEKFGKSRRWPVAPMPRLVDTRPKT